VLDQGWGEVVGLPKLPTGEPGAGELAGLQIGDTLLSVDGRNTAKRSLDDLVYHLEKTPAMITIVYQRIMARQWTAVANKEGLPLEMQSHDTLPTISVGRLRGNVKKRALEKVQGYIHMFLHWDHYQGEASHLSSMNCGAESLRCFVFVVVRVGANARDARYALQGVLVPEFNAPTRHFLPDTMAGHASLQLWQNVPSASIIEYTSSTNNNRRCNSHSNNGSSSGNTNSSSSRFSDSRYTDSSIHNTSSTSRAGTRPRGSSRFR
jgi:hypothetical protein